MDPHNLMAGQLHFFSILLESTLVYNLYYDIKHQNRDFYSFNFITFDLKNTFYLIQLHLSIIYTETVLEFQRLNK